MKKKITSILLCLSIIAAFIPAAMADNVPVTVPDLTLANDNGTITTEYSGENGGEGDLLILAEYGLSGALKSIQTTGAEKRCKADNDQAERTNIQGICYEFRHNGALVRQRVLR